MTTSSSTTPTLLEILGNRYERQPILRSLIQLIPYNVGSAIDSALMIHVNNLRADRLRIFFDELANGQIPLTIGVVNDSDFLHAYFCTIRAALNARREQKIRLFARLFRNLDGPKDRINFDDYEETLSILDELTLRELHALILLKQFELANSKQEGQNEMRQAISFWPSFLQTLKVEIGIEDKLIPGFLERLNRTGLYQTFVGGFLDYTGDLGHTTPYFEKFMEDLSIGGLSDVR